MSKFYQIFTGHALIRSIRWPNDISDLKCNSYLEHVVRPTWAPKQCAWWTILISFRGGRFAFFLFLHATLMPCNPLYNTS